MVRLKFIRTAVRCLLVLGMLVPGYRAVLATEPKPPDTVVFSTSFGPVTFTHAKHQAFSPQQCVTCHHPTAQGATYTCRSCHKRSIETTEGDPQSFSEVKMKFCRGCHARRKDEDQTSRAPVACEGCHEVQAAGVTDTPASP